MDARQSATTRSRKPRLKTVRNFEPSLEQLAAQNYDPAEEAGDALQRLYKRLTGPQQAAFLTTLSNALQMDKQGYKLQSLGQMRYRVYGGKGQLRPYIYDHATETCTCDLFWVLGCCKHSIWAADKLGEASALLAAPAINTNQSARAGQAPVNPWATWREDVAAAVVQAGAPVSDGLQRLAPITGNSFAHSSGPSRSELAQRRAGDYD